jgi:hypothetical protein
MSRLWLLLLVGCGSAEDAPRYVPLITYDWTLPPGSEQFLCKTLTLTEDVHAGTLHAIAPYGTHHMTITVNPGGEVDNPSFPCGPELGTFWASGTGGEPLVLPEGVGVLAAGGQQLRLGLHLFNAGDQPLSGTSGLEIIPLAREQLVHEASVTFHGPVAFEIPPSGQPYSVTEQTMLGDRTVVAVFPHMHQLGRHFRTSLGDTMLWDQEYEFEKQEFVAVPSIAAGDKLLETTCTWLNTTPAAVTWGNSTNAEMCFTILMTHATP